MGFRRHVLDGNIDNLVCENIGKVSTPARMSRTLSLHFDFFNGASHSIFCELVAFYAAR